MKILTTRDDRVVDRSKRGVRTHIRPADVQAEIDVLQRAGADFRVLHFRSPAAGSTKSRTCIVMPLLSGDLRDVGAGIRGISDQAAKEASFKALARSSLEYLTDVIPDGQVHNDVKADNFFVGRDGRVTLSDLGSVDDIRQTVQYASDHRAPEVGHVPHTKAADGWAWAMAMADMCTGKLLSQVCVDPYGRPCSKEDSRDALIRWWAERTQPPLIDERPLRQWYDAIAAAAGRDFARLLMGILSERDPVVRQDRIDRMRTYLQTNASADPTPELAAIAQRLYDDKVATFAPNPPAPAASATAAAAGPTETGISAGELALPGEASSWNAALELAIECAGMPWVTIGGDPTNVIRMGASAFTERNLFVDWAKNDGSVSPLDTWGKDYDEWFQKVKGALGDERAEAIRATLARGEKLEVPSLL